MVAAQFHAQIISFLSLHRMQQNLAMPAFTMGNPRTDHSSSLGVKANVAYGMVREGGRGRTEPAYYEVVGLKSKRIYQQERLQWQ